MKEIPNTKITIEHHGVKSIKNFASWDTPLDEMIEACKTLLVCAGYPNTAIEEYFNDKV